MFERISRSIELVKTSWRILMEDKKLLVFPLLSGIVTLIVIATFILPLIFSEGALSLATNSVTGIILLFLFYLVSYFVVIFFNVGLISCVNAKLHGKDMTIGEGLSAAGKHLGSILAWAIIAATVGLILRLIEDRAGFLGQIAAGLVGGIWSLVTMFVVPVLVFEEKGVFDAMKGSLGLFRKTWGESVVGSLSIGFVFFVVGIVGFLLVLATMMLQNALVFFAAIALFIVLIAILSILASAMQGIFVVALTPTQRPGRCHLLSTVNWSKGHLLPRDRSLVEISEFFFILKVLRCCGYRHIHHQLPVARRCHYHHIKGGQKEPVSSPTLWRDPVIFQLPVMVYHNRDRYTFC